MDALIAEKRGANIAKADLEAQVRLTYLLCVFIFLYVE